MSSSVGWLTEKCPSSTSWSTAQVVIRCAASTGSLVTIEHPVAARASAARRARREDRPATTSTAARTDLGRSQVASAQLLGAPNRDDLARVHHRHAVGQMLGLVHVVGGQEDVLPRSHSERIVDHAWRRAPGSKPVVGSSRKIRSGSPTSAERQIESAVLAAGQLPGLVSSASRPARRARSPRRPGGDAVVAAVHLDQLGDRQVVLHSALLEARSRRAHAARARRAPDPSRAPWRRLPSACGNPRGSRRSTSCRRRWAPADRTPLPAQTSKLTPRTASTSP